MKDYIREVIDNNAFTPDNVLTGKTGFVHWDSLEQKERDKLLVQGKKKRESMTPQEQAKLIDEFQAEIRKKQRADGGRLRNASSYDVIREIVNVDVPKAIEEFLLDLDRHNELELLSKLRGKSITDTILAIDIMLKELESPD